MKLFSRITFIFNLGFIAFIILQYIEINKKKSNSVDNIIPLPYLTGMLVIMGQLAIFINLIFCMLVVVLLALKRIKQIPRWLVISNFILLLIQLFYFFI
ncbi:hypothetical protein BH11BAC3_BH11BAC3_32040 [soil metagenome]